MIGRLVTFIVFEKIVSNASAFVILNNLDSEVVQTTLGYVADQINVVIHPVHLELEKK